MAKTKTTGRKESGNKDVRFRCVAPAAKTVFLAGTFNAWDPTATPMQPDGAAEWYV
jgi:1,4-alpha-glucan branching enzyme